MNLFKIIKWAEENGNERIKDRIRVLALAQFLKERIDFATINENTNASEELINKVRQAAENLIGNKCPF